MTVGVGDGGGRGRVHVEEAMWMSGHGWAESETLDFFSCPRPVTYVFRYGPTPSVLAGACPSGEVFGWLETVRRVSVRVSRRVGQRAYLTGEQTTRAQIGDPLGCAEPAGREAWGRIRLGGVPLAYRIRDAMQSWDGEWRAITRGEEARNATARADGPPVRPPDC